MGSQIGHRELVVDGLDLGDQEPDDLLLLLLADGVAAARDRRDVEPIPACGETRAS